MRDLFVEKKKLPYLTMLNWCRGWQYLKCTACIALFLIVPGFAMNPNILEQSLLVLYALIHTSSDGNQAMTITLKHCTQ